MAAPKVVLSRQRDGFLLQVGDRMALTLVEALQLQQDLAKALASAVGEMENTLNEVRD